MTETSETNRNLKLPPPTMMYAEVWESGNLMIEAEPDGGVWIEFERESDYYSAPVTQCLSLTRAQVLAILAASEWNPNDQH